MFNLYRSNRAEVLVDALAARLSDFSCGPFGESLVAVPSLAYGEWLRATIAEQRGIASGVRFLLPRALVERLLCDVMGRQPRELDGFRRESLRWAIIDRLAERGDQDGFESVADYLREDPGGRKLVQLGSKLAGLFDDYVVYRPEWALSWQEGDADQWQGRLFAELVQRFGRKHLAELALRFERSPEQDLRLETLPRRVAFIGVSSLPPVFLNIMGRLARWIDVDLYLSAPSAVYFADLKSPKEAARLGKKSDASIESEHFFTEGHPLLASLGQVGRDFQGILEEHQYSEPLGDLMVSPLEFGSHTALRCLQADLTNGAQQTPAGSLPDDGSVVLRSAVNGLRELEVLRDGLQALFEADSTLMPHDILVLMPDVEQYAPLIDTVFGDENDRPRLPYRVARRGLAAGSISDALIGLLSLIGGRFGGPEVLDFLSGELVSRRFGLSDTDVATVFDWVKRTGIRWGLSKDNRARRGHAPVAENTWEFGLRRLLVGYAWPGDGEHLFGSVLPIEEIGGTEDSRTLEGIVGLIDFLEKCASESEEPRPATEWCSFVISLLEDLLPAESSFAREASHVLAGLASLRDDIQRSESNPAMSFELFRGIVMEHIDGGSSGGGDFDGTILFGDLVPLHGIPARVVCLLGMNDGDFPRSSGFSSFDLIATAPRRGDRTLRGDDHYIFLEVLMAARDVFYVSYRTGEGLNSTCAPSPVVSEFAALIAGDELGDAEDGGVLLAPATGSHSDHFNPKLPALWSYSVKNMAAAVAKQTRIPSSNPFWTEYECPVLEDHDVISLDELLRFYRSPAAYLLQRSMKMELPFLEDALEEWEPSEVDYLERFQTGQYIVQRRLGGLGSNELYPIIKAMGVLPLGEAGRARFNAMLEKSDMMLGRIRKEMGGDVAGTLPVDLTVGSSRIVGSIEGVCSLGALSWRYGELSPRFRLAQWLLHLVGTVAAPSAEPWRSVLLGIKEKGWRVEYGPVTGAAEHLGRLVHYFRLGSRRPLLLFPGASYLYARTLKNAKGTEDEARNKALAAAQSAFEATGRHGDGEKHDPAVRQIFMGRDPFEETDGEGGLLFEEIARELLMPMIEGEVRP